MKKINEEENKVLEMKENDIINALIGEREIPTTTVIVTLDAKKGIRIPIVLKGLSRKRMDFLRKSCTKKNKLDGAEYDAAVIVEATTNFDWNNPKLLEDANVSDAKQYVLRKLLAGEINILIDKILELSGYGSELEEADTIKNSSAEEEE